MAKKVFEVSLLPIVAHMAMGNFMVDAVTFQNGPEMALRFGQFGPNVIGIFGAFWFAMATAIAFVGSAAFWDIGK